MKDLCMEGERLEGLSLAGETLEDCSFGDCLFVNCRFENCAFVRCHFEECRFEGCRFTNPAPRFSSMKLCEFVRCSLVGIAWGQWALSGRFALAPLQSLKECRLQYNIFSALSMRRFDFSGCRLEGCSFGSCSLEESRFYGCEMEGTEFTGCDLRRADLRETRGYRMDLQSNKLKDARFSFPDVVELLNGLGIRIE